MKSKFKVFLESLVLFTSAKNKDLITDKISERLPFVGFKADHTDKSISYLTFYFFDSVVVVKLYWENKNDNFWLYQIEVL